MGQVDGDSVRQPADRGNGGLQVRAAAQLERVDALCVDRETHHAAVARMQLAQRCAANVGRQRPGLQGGGVGKVAIDKHIGAARAVGALEHLQSVGKLKTQRKEIDSFIQS